MSSNARDNILIILFLAIFLWIGGKELWAFDRSAVPDYTARWSLSDTTPELYPLPKTKMRPNYTSNDTQLRLYKDTNEVVLYSPGTNIAYVMPCTDLTNAVILYNNFAVRYTYYIAEDRTYTSHKGNNDEVVAAETFLEYMYKRLDEPMGSNYGNRYIDRLTYVVDPNKFYSLIIQFNPNNPFIQHEYKTDINDMWNFVSRVYTPDTICSKCWALFE